MLQSCCMSFFRKEWGPLKICREQNLLQHRMLAERYYIDELLGLLIRKLTFKDSDVN
jgi:hypothetical protein